MSGQMHKRMERLREDPRGRSPEGCTIGVYCLMRPPMLAFVRNHQLSRTAWTKDLQVLSSPRATSLDALLYDQPGCPFFFSFFETGIYAQPSLSLISPCDSSNGPDLPCKNRPIFRGSAVDHGLKSICGSERKSFEIDGWEIWSWELIIEIFNL